MDVFEAQPTVTHVIGPGGRRLTLADLPLPATKRWVIRRKAEVVAAVRGGLLSLEEACSRYALNSDEFQSWLHCIDRFGLDGLRTTRTQLYLRPVAMAQSRLSSPLGNGAVRNLREQSNREERPTSSVLRANDCAPHNISIFRNRFNLDSRAQPHPLCIGYKT